MHKFYGQLNLPCEFNQWVDPYGPDIGPFNPRYNLNIERHLKIQDLKENNPEFCQWIESLGLEIYTARFLRSQPRAHYSIHIDINPMTGVPPNFYSIDQDFQAFEADELKIIADKDKQAEEHGYRYNNIINLNLVYSSKSSTMTWYKLKENCKPRLRRSFSNHYYYKFNKHECDVVFQTQCNSPCLVNSGVPHDLSNSDNDELPRICYSMMIQNKERTLTWDQAVELFTPWLDH